MQHLANFFDGIPWRSLRPRKQLVAAQVRDPAGYIAAASTNDHSVAVFYLPNGGDLQIEPGILSTSLRGTWFNPRDGKRDSATPAGPWKYTAPDTLDWVFLLSPPLR